MCAIGTIHWVSRQVSTCLDPLFIIYCLFAVGVVRLIRLVVSVAMVTASLALLYDSLMFLMNRVSLILLGAPSIAFVTVLTNVGIFWMCVLMNSSTAAIRIAMVIIIWRVWGVCWLLCCVVVGIVRMSVSAMSHPSSGILLVGTAFLSSLTFPTCFSSYSWQIFSVMGIFFTSLWCTLVVCPWLSFTSTWFLLSSPIMQKSLYFSWNALDVWSLTRTLSPIFNFSGSFTILFFLFPSLAFLAWFRLCATTR